MLYHNNILSGITSTGSIVKEIYLWSKVLSSTYNSDNINMQYMTSSTYGGSNAFTINKMYDVTKATNKIVNVRTNNSTNTIEYKNSNQTICVNSGDNINLWGNEINIGLLRNDPSKDNIMDDSNGICFRIEFNQNVSYPVEITIFMDPIDLTYDAYGMPTSINSYWGDSTWTKINNLSMKKSFSVGNKSYCDVSIPADMETMVNANELPSRRMFLHLFVCCAISCTVSKVVCNDLDDFTN